LEKPRPGLNVGGVRCHLIPRRDFGEPLFEGRVYPRQEDWALFWRWSPWRMDTLALVEFYPVEGWNLPNSENYLNPPNTSEVLGDYGKWP